MASTDERRPYRIIRGSLSRRDGAVVYPMDEHGRRIENAKPKKGFVHYSAKTQANPDARDEVELTDAEALAFGLTRLQRISRRNIITETPDDAPIKPISTTAIVSANDEDFLGMVNKLIVMGNKATGMAEATEFRKRVENSGVLTDVPKRKADIIEALKNLLN